MNAKAIFDATRTNTKLDKVAEKAFQKWYKVRAKKAGIGANPDDPLHMYDYRGVFKAGEDMMMNDADKKYHWPSKYKHLDHPNRFVGGEDTITGKKVRRPK